MGRVIRKSRKGKGSVFTSHSTGRIVPCKLRKFDQIKREGYIKGVVKDIVHNPGLGDPLRDPHKYKLRTEYFIASEGMHKITLGNILPLNAMPEGSSVCNVETKCWRQRIFC